MTTATPGGPIVIETAVPGPNPNPTGISVLLNGPVDTVELRIWSKALRLLVRTQSGPGGPGWLTVPLPAGFVSSAPNGLYFYSVQASQGSRRSKTVVGRFMVVH